MSLPPQPQNRIPLSEKALAAQAAEVERLRSLVAAAQSEGGKLDPALVAQFAQAQRAFLDAKIQMEQLRKAGLLVVDETEPQAAAAPTQPIEAESSAAVTPAESVEVSPAVQKSGGILTASRVFWLLVVFLLTALLWFMGSKYAGQ